MGARGSGRSARRPAHAATTPAQHAAVPALAVTRGAATTALPLDADERAILVLCCSQHVIGCPSCHNTLRLGWLGSMGRDEYPCPLCAADLASVVVAHTRTCAYFTRRSERKPPVKVERAVEPPEAATA